MNTPDTAPDHLVWVLGTLSNSAVRHLVYIGARNTLCGRYYVTGTHTPTLNMKCTPCTACRSAEHTHQMFITTPPETEMP